MSMVVTSINAATRDRAGSPSSIVSVPSIVPKRPFSLAKARKLNENRATELSGSTFHVPAAPSMGVRRRLPCLRLSLPACFVRLASPRRPARCQDGNAEAETVHEQLEKRNQWAEK